MRSLPQVSHTNLITLLHVTYRNSIISGQSVPVAIVNLWQSSISATATTGIPPYITYRADGLFILLPGTAVSMSGLGTTIAGATHMIWEEVPLPI